MFEGLIWFIMPILMVVINDVMAYMFGFFFGKTPLIKLSPKKTWEGFVGGAVIFFTHTFRILIISIIVNPINFSDFHRDIDSHHVTFYVPVFLPNLPNR